MNPIAASCAGVEKATGALRIVVGPISVALGSYTCAGDFPGNPWDGLTWNLTTKCNTSYSPFLGEPWQTSFLSTTAHPTGAQMSLWSPAIPMHPAMDGPYSVLYNTVSSIAYLVDGTNSASPNSTDLPVEIPAFGIWIYSSGERPDYPEGVEVITIDPHYTPTPDPKDGRCISRKQFVTTL